MAEEALVKDILTAEMIHDGRQLTGRLMENRELEITAALWFYFIDNLRWNLMFGISQVLREGTFKAYTIIQAEMKARPVGGVSFSDIIVLQSDHPTIRRLDTFVKASSNTAEVRVSRSVVDNVYIEDAYVYLLSYPREQAA